MKNREYLLSFMDGKATFVNEIKLSKNIKFEKRDKYLYCDNAILGHTGVSTYYDHELGGTSNKKIKVHKYDTDLLTTDSIATIVGKPISVMHPRTKEGKVLFIDGTNFKEFEVGTVLDAWRDGDNIVGKLVVKDQVAVADILDGKLKSLSLGYSASLTKISDSEYKQEDFYFNHLALVPKGRMMNAGIIDHDSVEEGESEMSVLEKIKSFFQKGEPEIKEDGTFEFVDDKLVTRRFRVVEETNTYDTETGEQVYETNIHEKETHTKEDDKGNVIPPTPYIDGDEGKVVEEVKNEEIAVVDEESDLKQEEGKNLNKNEETQERKVFGDGEMTDEIKKALIQEIKENIIKDIKEKNVFNDINPINPQNQTEQKSYVLDFERDEMLRKEAYDLATNPVRHNGDFAKLQEARERIFK